MISITRLDTTAADFRQALDRLIAWDVATDDAVTTAVAGILADVRSRGDLALLEYTRRFDHIEASNIADLTLDPKDLTRALMALPEEERLALELAAQRIRSFHEHQIGEDWSIEDEHGSRLGSRVTTLDRVGIYVPGGQAAYPSSVLMTVIPARVAGVREITVTVPTPNGVKNPLVLAALAIGGVDRVYTIGGAQAIGALAYGTQSIGRVDKIVGPGGAYVAAAKRQVFGPVGIDSIAGPSEILVIADGSAPAEWVALDLFSQAEHDADAQSILLCPDASYIDAVASAMDRLIDGMRRQHIIRASLQRRGALVKTTDLNEAVAIANRVAPEHLELAVADPHALMSAVRHAGAIFLGSYSGETLGDYVAGPSHVLPTFGTARFASPLGVYDFQKRSSVIEISAKGASELARSARVIAEGEGLDAHARAAQARIHGIDHNRQE